jgi:hypothetical protein
MSHSRLILPPARVSTLSRRRFIAGLFVAPALIRSGLLMPVRPIILPEDVPVMSGLLISQLRYSVVARPWQEARAMPEYDLWRRLR